MVDIGFYCKVRDYGQVRLAANYVLRLPSSFTLGSGFSILLQSSRLYCSLLLLLLKVCCLDGVGHSLLPLSS